MKTPWLVELEVTQQKPMGKDAQSELQNLQICEFVYLLVRIYCVNESEIINAAMI